MEAAYKGNARKGDQVRLPLRWSMMWTAPAGDWKHVFVGVSDKGPPAKPEPVELTDNEKDAIYRKGPTTIF